MKKAVAIVATLALALVGAVVALRSVDTQRFSLTPDLTYLAQELAGDCVGGDKVSCQQLRAVDLAISGDVEGASRLIDNDADKSDAYRSRCHDVSHMVGRISYAVIGIERTFSELPGGCGGGLHHGAQEQWGHGRSTVEIIAEAKEMCALSRTVNYAAFGACVHSIGHSLEGSSDDPYDAARVCSVIFSDDDADVCAEGSIMSYVDKYSTDIRKKTRPPASLTELEKYFERCNELRGESVDLCVVSLGRLLYRSLYRDAAEAMAFCNGVPGALATECAFGVGHEIAYNFNPEPERVAETCVAIGGPLLDGCLAGGAKLVGVDFLRPEGSQRVCEANPAGVGPRCQRVLNMLVGYVSALRALEDR